VLREDIRNENLLYLGTEFAAWASLDRGDSWVKINNNLPTVAVHEFAQHPTVNELVAATHGRSIWILDVTMLRQLNEDTLEAKAHLFEPATAVRWQYLPRRGGTNRSFQGTNPQRGAHIYYSLKEKARGVTLKVVDVAGKTVRDLRASGDAGMHRVTWDLIAPGKRSRQGQPAPGRAAEDGLYRIVLAVDGKEYSTTLRVEGDPEAPKGVFLAEELEGEEDDDEEIVD
jgi:hypothetical protein